ncbi:E3 ubiquitin-protein ligase SH3RF1 [Corythoichthys intestinalis]|uniref:E3 ubiquitin-protein ligase SH3RF1 n=1 Tax=Corythoichthys intestinalis TaxID=161448 RepID=UPI0025A4E6B8|nr:E3 ubiquitin-protein ligase SH3RF1 [Corythoichthys intestinalis]XP_061790719.1 E3 ubiquitin-protein ligase SH3RF1-like [Nerophis lumbriciformis]
MDESMLLDLLECPVCLERLDASAKVLPCQHTFCRRCLQGIVGSRGELRCPECRTLVECAVDELPSNILLVRLLDGIKQRPRRAAPVAANGAAGAAARPHAAGNRNEQGVPGAQPQRAQVKSSLVRGVPQLPCAKALYNYDGKEPGDLKFSKGDVIILRRQVDENWYHGEMGGVHGFFPTNFVQIIKPLPQPPPQCKALYDFELKDKEADKDCLPFAKDDILTVIRRVDENWAEGMLGDKIGIFPISYVEFNSAARQLIESDKPSDSNGESGEGASSGPQSNGGQRDKKNSKKRHSFTSLTMSHKPMLAPPPQRHSMEISGPVLISSSNPTAAARIGEITGGLSCSAPSQVHICTTGLIVTPPPSSPVTTATVFTFPPETNYTPIPLDALPPPPPPPPQSSAGGAGYSSAAGQRPSPNVGDQGGRQRPTVYVAMFPYAPRKEDELELRKGEMFLVLERCQDGWFKGTSMHTGKIGVFPGNYMSPVSRTASGNGQAKVAMSLCTQAGRGITIVSPSSGHHGAVAAGPDSAKHPAAVQPAAAPVTTAQTATGQQPKAPLHVSSQMTVNQARNAVRTAACHGQERPTAAIPPVHLGACPQPSAGPAQGCARAAAALGCAAASLTPPNVSAASLEGEGLRPVPILTGNGAALNAAATSAALASRLDKDIKREKKSLLKLLSNKKKPRQSPPSSPTLEAEQAAVGESVQGAAGPEASPPSGPDPDAAVPSSSSSSDPSSNRRNAAPDGNAPIAPPPRQPCSSLSSLQHDARPIICERYRVVVSYPPQSEAELELKEGDVVFVHRKREDGWFKGTLQRNGRTGLFPGSFVDSI